MDRVLLWVAHHCDGLLPPSRQYTDAIILDSSSYRADHIQRHSTQRVSRPSRGLGGGENQYTRKAGYGEGFNPLRSHQRDWMVHCAVLHIAGNPSRNVARLFSSIHRISVPGYRDDQEKMEKQGKHHATMRG